MFKKTIALLYPSYGAYIRTKTDFNESHKTAITPTIKKIYSILDNLYDKESRSKSLEKMELNFEKVLNRYQMHEISVCLSALDKKNTVYISNESTVVGESSAQNDINNADKIRCEIWEEALELRNEMREILEIRKKITKYSEKLSQYLKLHDDFLICPSPYDDRIIDLTRKQIKINRALVDAHALRNASVLSREDTYNEMCNNIYSDMETHMQNDMRDLAHEVVQSLTGNDKCNSDRSIIYDNECSDKCHIIYDGKHDDE